MARSRAVAGAIDTAAPKPSFNWVIPIALVVPAVRYMQSSRESARAERLRFTRSAKRERRDSNPRPPA
jgi:hypothetical protein